MIQAKQIPALTDAVELRVRLEDLEKTQRATLNILEDFDAERVKLQQLQRASVNILEDMDEERRQSLQYQKATLNLLEDMDKERNKLDEIQRATLNVLEDFDAERVKLQQLQRASVNILEDMDEERRQSQLYQKATLNLLEDMNEERNKLDEIQRALLNMLDDIESERFKTEQARVLLESANKELEAFSYSVSHDLRAPLRAISGYSQAVMEDYAPRLDEEGQRYLGLIRENAHRMGRLIDDLLAFSRLSRQQMAESEVDLEALAKSVFEELLILETDRHITFTTQPVPPIFGDISMIRQVLINLLSNAIKFTRTRQEALIEFGYGHQSGEDAYYIKDNGVGFDMQYVSKLFGVFQRLHSVTEYEGTGVGLALVNRIVTRHRGRVWAESCVNQGATFYFTFPRRP